MERCHVIPANAENPALAHEFINYVLSYDASYGNSEYVGYASSNQEVLDTLSGEGGYYENNEAYLPVPAMRRTRSSTTTRL